MKPYSLKEHESHFVVDHGDGKPFKVAKKGLSKALHAKIRQFAEGGEVFNDRKQRLAGLVSGDDEAGSRPSAPSAPPPHTDWWGALKGAMLPKGAQVKKMADGGKPEETTDTPVEESTGAPTGPEAPNFLPSTSNPLTTGGIFPGGSKVSPWMLLGPLGMGANAAAGWKEQQDTKEEAEDARQKIGEGPLFKSPGEVPLSPEAQAQLYLKTAERLTGGAGGAGRPDQLNEYAKAEHGAILHQADVQRSEYDQLSQMQQQHVAQVQAGDKQFMDERAQRMQEQKAMREKIAQGEIDPNHWLNSRTTGQKISGAIGLILGGLGAGLTKGPNQALEMMQRDIDRDIESQKANLGKQQSDYSNLLQEGYNADQAHRVLRSDMMSDAAAKATQIAYASGGEKAIATAQLLAAQTDKQNSMDHVKVNSELLQQRHTQLGIQGMMYGLEMEKTKRAVMEQYLRTGQMAPGTELFLDKELLNRIRAQQPDAKTLETEEAYKTRSDKSGLAKLVGAIPGMQHLPNLLPSSREAEASDTQILQGLMSMEGITRPTHPAVKGWEKMLQDTHSINSDIAKAARQRLAGIMTAHAEARRRGATATGAPAVDTTSAE